MQILISGSVFITGYGPVSKYRLAIGDMEDVKEIDCNGCAK